MSTLVVHRMRRWDNKRLTGFHCVAVLQELTEEGIPFLILFHHPDDSDTPARFRSIVAAELADKKS